MIKHIVLFMFKDDAEPEEIAAIFQHFTVLQQVNSAIRSYTFGQYNGCATMPNHGFNYGFEMEFANEEDRDHFMENPEHLSIAPRIYAMLKDGANSIMAFGYDTDSQR